MKRRFPGSWPIVTHCPIRSYFGRSTSSSPCCNHSKHCKIAAMGAPDPVEQKQEGHGHECAPGTLGDVLYVDKAKTPIPEKEWVALVQAIASGDQRALHALYER